MKLSRRGILGGLLATGAVPAAAMEMPQPKPSFVRGMVMPRPVMIAVNERGNYLGAHHAVTVFEYDIFDGEKFVPLNSNAGQRVVADLS